MRETSEGRVYVTEKHPDTLHFQCYSPGCPWTIEVKMTNEGYERLHEEYGKHWTEKHV